MIAQIKSTAKQTYKDYKNEKEKNMGLEWRNKWRRKHEINNKYIPGFKILVADVETTGLKKDSKIIQFSSEMYKVKDDLSLQKISELNLYINPGEKLEPKITEITGITDEMLLDAESEQQAAKVIFPLFEEADIIAGYNIGFDIGMIDYFAKRTVSRFRQKPLLDVCEMARDFVPKSEAGKCSLGNAVKFVFPDTEFSFHDSSEDVRATALLLEHFAGIYTSLEHETEKVPIHMEKAHLFVNPRKPSMQRICLVLSQGNDGDIFYDIPGHFWSCKSTAAAKKLFKSIDMCNLEDQVYAKYVYPFRHNSIDEMAKSWLKYRREKLKKA